MFDVLDSKTPIDRNLVIEASAGTGKTFSIQHLVIRNLLRGVKLSEILVVTFTKASTKELKDRILDQLREIVEGNFPPYFPEGEKKCAENAMREFDASEIDTIHAFAKRMLSIYAFEANLYIEQMEEDGSIDQEKQLAVRDFFRTDLEGLSYGLSQKKILLSMELKVPEKSFGPFYTFAELFDQFQQIPFPEGPLDEYGEELVRAIQNPSLETFDQLLLNPPEIKKKKIPYWLEKVQQIIDYALSKEILKARFWHDISPLLRERTLANGKLGFDEMLLGMQEALQSPAFIQAVQKRYKAVLIDEFQDTDPVQWDIFSQLFLKGWPGVLYLVGDPKQSIYGFRNADIYTYLRACEEMGEQAKVALDTNFRSHPSLVDSLNRFFEGEQFIPLPKLGAYLPYHPVRAGRKDSPDGERLEFVEGTSFEEVLNDMAALIQQKKCQGCAVLIKDKNQGREVSECFKKYNIPHFFLKRPEWTEHPAVYHMKLFIKALKNPSDLHRLKSFLASPLGGYSAKQLENAPFSEWINRLNGVQNLGLYGAFRRLIGPSIADYPIYIRLVEMAENKEDVETFLDRLYLGIEKEEDQLFNPKEHQGAGVAICTIHLSKGLEFDHVFALGLSAAQRKTEDAEVEAEWIRQLYVAMTRAKETLYVPIYPVKGRSILSCYPIKETIRKAGLVPDPHFSISQKEINRKPVIKSTYQKKVQLIHSYTSLAGANEPVVLEPLPDGSMPRGKEVGITLHALLEKMPYKMLKSADAFKEWIKNELEGDLLQGWIGFLGELFHALFEMKLPGGFCLREVDLVRELDFLCCTERDFTNDPTEYLTGKMDALFSYGEKYYLIDWKSSWLEDYEEETLRKYMELSSYPLQAKIYKKALKLSVEAVEKRPFEPHFGGCFYIFLRGIHEGKGVVLWK